MVYKVKRNRAHVALELFQSELENGECAHCFSVLERILSELFLLRYTEVIRNYNAVVIFTGLSCSSLVCWKVTKRGVTNSVWKKWNTGHNKNIFKGPVFEI